MTNKYFDAPARFGAVMALVFAASLAGSGVATAAGDSERIEVLEARMAQLNADVRKISVGIDQIDQRMDRLDDMEIRLVRMSRELRQLRREVQLVSERADPGSDARLSPRPMLLPSSW